MNDRADLAEHIRGKWFEPITERLEAFENNIALFPEFEAITEADSAEWAVQCAIKAIKPFGNLLGMPFDGQFGAQQVGAMVGAKASICSAMANSHVYAQRWSKDDRKKFIRVWGDEALREALVTWERFASVLRPEFDGVRRFAVNLAMRQGLEDIDFHRGLTKGLTFMLEVRKTIRKAITKAERDTQNRTAVYFFAVSAWEAIEANREELSWPELAEGCNEAFDHKIGVDEDTFKKILQRCGLGIGKAGRRIPIST